MKSGRKGFTLIELLVIVLVIGVSAGLVTVTFRPSERATIDIEAQRLARLLELAALESRASGNAIAWTSDGQHYRFWRQVDRAWSEILDNDALRARSLPN